MADKYERVSQKLAAIEQAMKQLGFWQNEPLKPEQHHFNEAFAMDTMTFNQWLQFIFSARVKRIIAERGHFPASSSVGAQAIREFDGNAEAQALVSLLCEFDELFS